MAQKTIPPSHIMAVAGTIDPDVYVAGATSSDWIDMSVFTDIMAIIMAGTLGTAATLDAKLEQATDGSGTGVKDITGLAITQLVKATDDDKQAIINCSAEDLDVNNDFTHVRLTMTVAVADSDCGAVVLGSNARYGPASDNDLASVAEIIYS